MCMGDRHETSEEMFRLPPVSLLRMPPCEEEAGSGGEGFLGADQDTESEMGETEEDSSLLLVPSGLESSSTVPTGSNLLYLSDQVSQINSNTSNKGLSKGVQTSQQRTKGWYPW